MKRNLIILILYTLLLSFFVGCASTPEGLGDGSESGYLFYNAKLPDGTILNMTLLKDQNDYQNYLKSTGNEYGKWYMKHTLSIGQIFKLNSKNLTIEENDIFVKQYDFNKCGELANTMFQKGLPLAIAIVNIGSERRQYMVSFTIDKTWQTARYSKIDLIDRSTYMGKQAENKSTHSTQSYSTSKSQSPWLWHGGDIGARTNSSFGSTEIKKGFAYRIVYNDGYYCYCIDKNKNWYLRNSSGALTLINTYDVPEKVRALEE